MTYGERTYHDFRAYGHEPPPRRRAFPLRLVAFVCLSGLAVAAGLRLSGNLLEPVGETTIAERFEPVMASASASATVVTKTVTREDTVLFDRAFLWTSLPQALSNNDASRAELFSPLSPMAPQQLALYAPAPAPRLPRSAPASRPPAQIAQQQNNPPAANDQPSLFRRLLNGPKTPGTVLAYASPDGGVLGDGQSMTLGRAPTNEPLTAVYDISARTVYMPDGTKLEAHSGLGSMLDDPRHVHIRMRGPTPPSVYNLTLRESLFHGVRAIRLVPVGGNPYGRTGLLAHTYMLGPNGESNGCVSFKNYNAFLQAFLNHKVERLIVVAKLEN